MRVVLIILCALPLFVFAGNHDTITIKHKGNTFDIARQSPDTLITMHLHTYVQVRSIVMHPLIPLRINGNTIYTINETDFIYKAAVSTVNDCIETVFKTIRDELPVGSYSYELPDLVINEHGKIVFFTSNAFTTSREIVLTEQQYKTINSLFEKALEDIELIPLVIDGERTSFRIDIKSNFRLAQ